MKCIFTEFTNSKPILMEKGFNEIVFPCLCYFGILRANIVLFRVSAITSITSVILKYGMISIFDFVLTLDPHP